MGFAENVLNKVSGTPAFKPTAVDTFGNWAIEAGDIVTVDNDGVVETIPIFSSDMNWNGSAITTIACTGNQKREILDKQDRKDYAMSSGLSGYTNRKVEELSDSFGVELGAVRSSLDVYAKKTDDLETASADLTTRVTGAEASIKLNAENINGVASSVAAIQADVIDLKGRVDVTGSLSVSDGIVNVKSNLFVDGAITSYTNYIGIGGNYYEPKQITSASGTVLVLGIA